MAFHLWTISEVYSNADASVQYIELFTGASNTGENFIGGHTISFTSAGGSAVIYTVPSHLPAGSTGGKSVLIGNVGYAALTGVPDPDYILPDGFLLTTGGTLSVFGVDSITFGPGILPADGTNSLNDTNPLQFASNLVVSVNSPRNFAGATGTIPLPGGSVITGTDGPDSLPGTAGDDYISGLDGNDTLDGRAGNDTIFAGEGGDTVSGGDGGDTLVGHADIFNSVADVLDGGAGDDTLYAEASDSIQGGAGRDLLYIVNSNPINISLGAAGIEWVGSEFGDDVIDGSSQTVGIEVYSDGGNDNITGSAFADIIWSGSGSDTVMGGGGNDVIVADIGIDSVSGGDGNDSLYVDSGDTFDGGAGFDAAYISNAASMTVDMAAAHLEWARISVVYGSSATIDASAQTTGVEVYVGVGDVAVIGSGFNDYLYAGLGNDTLNGLDGDDVLVGDSVFGGRLLGGAGNDRIYSNAAVSLINGGPGFDALYVTAPTPGTILNGVNINLANTSIEWIDSLISRPDVIDGSGLTVATVVYAGLGDDTVTGGSGADFLWGEDQNDTILGNDNDDVLVGGSGSDSLLGGAGNDNLYGNGGSGGDGAQDTFVFSDGWGNDFVFDFEDGVDQLDVSAVTGINSFADLAVTNTPDGHAYVTFGGGVIAVANASGLIDAGDFLLV